VAEASDLDEEENSDEEIEEDLESDSNEIDETGSQVEESESVSDDNEIPELVEIQTQSLYKSSTTGIPYECDKILTQNDFNRIKQLKKEAEAKRRRMDIDLLPGSDEESNEFIGEDDLETMQISKHEKIKQSIEDKKVHKRHKKDKKGGKTNKQHAKSKPMMMVVGKKKNSMKRQFEAVKKKIRRSKQQLGKFSKRFNSTKRQSK
jgi:protein SDA1